MGMFDKLEDPFFYEIGKSFIVETNQKELFVQKIIQGLEEIRQLPGAFDNLDIAFKCIMPLFSTSNYELAKENFRNAAIIYGLRPTLQILLIYSNLIIDLYKEKYGQAQFVFLPTLVLEDRSFLELATTNF